MDNEVKGFNVKESLENLGIKIVDTFNGRDIEKNKKIFYNCIGFLGCAGGVGTSTIAYEVANLLAKDKRTVCIVDLNLMKPYMFTKHIENRRKDNLKAMLNGMCELGDIIVKGNIHFIERKPFEIDDLVSLDREEYYENMREVIKVLKQIYDVVIIDYNIDCFFYALVQGALKETMKMICIYNDSTSSYINKERIESAIKRSTRLEPIYILNNHISGFDIKDKVEVILPREDSIRENDRLGNSYVLDGNSNSSLLYEQLNKVKDLLV